MQYAALPEKEGSEMDIDIDNLSVEFTEQVALSGVSLRFTTNRIHGLLGRNGAGKTTLLSAMAGFRRPASGRVLIDGEPVFENPKATRSVCFVREVPDTLDSGERVLSTLEFTEQMRPTWDGELARSLLDRFHLDPEQKIGSLSRGMRAALGIVIGMAVRAPVTLFDESHLGLDAAARAVFYEELLADYMQNPRTIVFSTHLIDEVSRLFEEVTILHKGRLLLQQNGEELSSMAAEIVGPSNEVDRLVAGRELLAVRSLGRTKAVTIVRDDLRHQEAREAGLEVNSVSLQDLFVHLTGEENHGSVA